MKVINDSIIRLLGYLSLIWIKLSNQTQKQIHLSDLYFVVKRGLQIKNYSKEVLIRTSRQHICTNIWQMNVISPEMVGSYHVIVNRNKRFLTKFT